MKEVTNNPILESGDFFVIDDTPQEIEDQSGLKVSVVSELYGAVFEAKEVCGQYVAAKIIERGSSHDSPGVIYSLNWRRHKICLVTKEYAEAFMASRKFDQTLEDFEELEREFFRDAQREANRFTGFEESDPEDTEPS